MGATNVAFRRTFVRLLLFTLIRLICVTPPLTFNFWTISSIFAKSDWFRFKMLAMPLRSGNLDGLIMAGGDSDGLCVVVDGFCVVVDGPCVVVDGSEVVEEGLKSGTAPYMCILLGSREFRRVFVVVWIAIGGSDEAKSFDPSGGGTESTSLEWFNFWLFTITPRLPWPTIAENLSQITSTVKANQANGILSIFRVDEHSTHNHAILFFFEFYFDWIQFANAIGSLIHILTRQILNHKWFVGGGLRMLRRHKNFVQTALKCIVGGSSRLAFFLSGFVFISFGAGSLAMTANGTHFAEFIGK